MFILLRTNLADRAAVHLQSASTRLETEVATGRRARLGSFPFGRYSVRIEAEGAAPVLGTVVLSEGAAAHELAYDVTPGAVLAVHVDVSAFNERPAIATKLQYVPPHEFSIDCGPLAEAGVDENGRVVYRSRPLASGHYRLFLDGEGVEHRELELDVARNLTIYEVLKKASSGAMTIIDTEGNAVAEVEAAFGWSDDDGTKHVVRRLSDDLGRISLPAFEPPKAGTVRLFKSGFRPLTEEVLSGEHRVLVLRPGGRLSARLDASSCARSQVRATLSYRRRADQTYFPVGEQSPEGCGFLFDIDEPGEYRLLVVAPDASPAERVLSAQGDLDADAGLIHLEDGAPLVVVARSRKGPVEGATVTLIDLLASRVTDHAGRADFECVPNEAKSVMVRVEHPEYGAVAKNLSPGWNREVVVDLLLASTIEGRVARDDGTTDGGRTVILIGPDLRMRTSVTDAGGFYELSGLAAGRWQVALQVRSDDHGVWRTGPGAMRTIDLAEGQTAEVDFVPSFAVEGPVLGLPDSGRQRSLVALHGAGYSVTIPIDKGAWLSTTLPASGTWRFVHQLGSVDAQIVPPCPCLVTLDFAKSAGVTP